MLMHMDAVVTYILSMGLLVILLLVWLVHKQRTGQGPQMPRQEPQPRKWPLQLHLHLELPPPAVWAVEGWAVEGWAAAWGWVAADEAPIPSEI